MAVPSHKQKRCCGDTCHCGEEVGYEDAAAITEQLEAREKNCMWCGEDFDLSEVDIVHILNGDDFDMDDTLERLNRNSRHILDQLRDNIVDTNNFDFMLRDLKPKKAKTKSEKWFTQKKLAILERFGIDIEKEKFDPGYADSKGEPRDRMADGIPYEQADQKRLVHRMLKYVKNNPGCNTSDLVKKSMHCKTTRVRTIDRSPAARLVASGLIEYTSEFSGLYKDTNKGHISRFFGQIPRFKRKFTITKQGKCVLKQLENGKSRVML